MKWYKKQLDQLKKKETPKDGSAKSRARHSFDTKNLKIASIPSPVAESTRQRKKTDLY